MSHRIGKKERDEIFSLTRAVYIRRGTRNARNLATLNAETINCLQLIIIGESSFINITITLRFCSLCTSRLTRLSRRTVRHERSPREDLGINFHGKTGKINGNLIIDAPRFNNKNLISS